MSDYTLLNNKVREYKNFITNAEAAELVSYVEANASKDDNVNLLNLDSLPPAVESIKNRVATELADIAGEADFEFKVLKLWIHPSGAYTTPSKYFDFTFRVYLNDEYEGGEFVIPSKGISIKPEALSLFVFDSADPFGVDPVKGDFNKYSMGGSIMLASSAQAEQQRAGGPNQ